MTVAEFAGCTLLAFGTPFSMFLFTIMHDPIRIIILIAAAFMWLIALLVSSLVWMPLNYLGSPTIVGIVLSVGIQEFFRLVLHHLLRRTEAGLREFSVDAAITDNKHIVAYVSGLGFGIMSGAFALVNILADATGPGTMGLLGGSDIFFLTSAAQTLCMVLLHTCWSVVFIDASDTKHYAHMSLVVLAHLAVSLLTLLNRWELYAVTLLGSYAVLLFSAFAALRVAGGSAGSLVRFIKCQ